MVGPDNSISATCRAQPVNSQANDIPTSDTRTDNANAGHGRSGPTLSGNVLASNVGSSGNWKQRANNRVMGHGREWRAGSILTEHERIAPHWRPVPWHGGAANLDHSSMALCIVMLDAGRGALYCAHA